ncbi:MAG: peroxiredoxin [Candidatus Sigynarchaeum springense]
MTEILGAIIMPVPKIGDAAPDFKLQDQDGNERALKDFKGKWIVLYFYPKDNTPGCCTEAIGFTNIFEEFQKLDAQIIGVSADTVQSHKKFVDKYKLKVTLLSDKPYETIKAYGAYKANGGHISRDTILIDPAGKVAFTWKAVKPKDHPAEVKSKIAELRK